RKRTSADPHAATLGGGGSTPAFQITTARRCSFVNGQLSAVYAIRAQRTYSVRSLTENPLERPRTKLKFAPGFLIRSAPKPRLRSAPKPSSRSRPRRGLTPEAPLLR